MSATQVFKYHASNQLHAGPVLLDKVKDQAYAGFPELNLGHGCRVRLSINHGIRSAWNRLRRDEKTVSRNPAIRKESCSPRFGSKINRFMFRPQTVCAM